MLRRTGSRQRADAVLSTLDGDSAWARARARAESHVVCLEFDAALEAASAARDPGVWLVVAGTAGTTIRSMTGWRHCARGSVFRVNLSVPPQRAAWGILPDKYRRALPNGPE
jgi:hypothetical protein